MRKNSVQSDQGNRETVAVFASDRTAFWPLPISGIRRGGSDNGSNDITRLGETEKPDSDQRCYWGNGGWSEVVRKTYKHMTIPPRWCGPYSFVVVTVERND